MIERHVRVMTAVGLLGMALVGTSAAARPVDLSVINDEKAHTDARIKAIHATREAIASGEADAATVREMLKRVAWGRGAFFKVRDAAFDELLVDESQIEDTKNMMRLMMPTETQWEIIGRMCDEATARGWTDFAPVIVRSWSRPVPEPPDDERPERRALEKLFPERTAEESVYAVFSGAEGGAALKERERLDAFALLRRIDKGGERTRALLAGEAGAAGDPLIDALRAGARDLRAVPENGEQLAWLMRLRDAKNASYWSECASALARLDEEQARGLELRHAPIVRWCATAHPDWLSRSKADLYQDAKTRLDRAKKHLRTRESMTSDTPETLWSWEKKLTWGDLLSILTAEEIVNSKAIAGSLFLNADKDTLDRSTEHGGLFADAGGGVAVTPFLPRASQRAGDTTFVAPNDMIETGDTALFHYHFHANKQRNAEFAGPSPGDIDAARNLGRGSLVFTFITKDTLNADYYQGNGVRVDLGEIKRSEQARARP